MPSSHALHSSHLPPLHFRSRSPVLALPSGVDSESRESPVYLTEPQTTESPASLCHTRGLCDLLCAVGGNNLQAIAVIILLYEILCTGMYYVLLIGRTKSHSGSEGEVAEEVQAKEENQMERRRDLTQHKTTNKTENKTKGKQIRQSDS